APRRALRGSLARISARLAAGARLRLVPAANTPGRLGGRTEVRTASRSVPMTTCNPQPATCRSNAWLLVVGCRLLVGIMRPSEEAPRISADARLPRAAGRCQRYRHGDGALADGVRRPLDRARQAGARRPRARSEG